MPASIASNWDFTAVINLLHSPAHSGGDLSGSSHHTEEHVAPSSSEGSKAINKFSSIHPEQTGVKYDSNATPRLGDFGSLWDVLGQSATTAFVAGPVGDRQDADATPRAESPQIPAPIKILKRPSHKSINSATSTQEPPRTPPKSIPRSSTPKARNTKGTGLELASTGNKGARAKAAYEASSSDTAEAESDGNVSIFDPPLSNNIGALSLKSPRFDTSVKPELDDSPPSSFDELEGSLTAETIKRAPDNGVIRIRSDAYQSAKKQKAGLLRKLAQNFPDYAGTFLNSNSGNSPRPIHVFVDISNVSLFLG